MKLSCFTFQKCRISGQGHRIQQRADIRSILSTKVISIPVTRFRLEADQWWEIVLNIKVRKARQGNIVKYIVRFFNLYTLEHFKTQNNWRRKNFPIFIFWWNKKIMISIWNLNIKVSTCEKHSTLWLCAEINRANRVRAQIREACSKISFLIFIRVIWYLLGKPQKKFFFCGPSTIISNISACEWSPRLWQCVERRRERRQGRDQGVGNKKVESINQQINYQKNWLSIGQPN